MFGPTVCHSSKLISRPSWQVRYGFAPGSAGTGRLERLAIVSATARRVIDYLEEPGDCSPKRAEIGPEIDLLGDGPAAPSDPPAIDGTAGDPTAAPPESRGPDGGLAQAPLATLLLFACAGGLALATAPAPAREPADAAPPAVAELRP